MRGLFACRTAVVDARVAPWRGRRDRRATRTLNGATPGEKTGKMSVKLQIFVYSLYRQANSEVI